MSALQPALRALTKPLLTTLLALHGVVHSWTLALILFVILIKILHSLLTLLTPGFSARRRYDKELAELKKKFDYNASPEYRLQEFMLQQKHALPPHHGPRALALRITDLLLRGYAYFGLWYVLICAPELRGELLPWIPDMSAPDPSYVLPLCVFLLFGAGVLMSRRKLDLSKSYNWFLILVPPGWAGLNAFLPAGLCFYHLISYWMRPLTTLLLGVPVLVTSKLSRLRGR